MTKASTLKLSMLGLPIIKSLDELQLHSHISKRTIYQLSIRSKYQYKTYKIKKKTGKFRVISQPNRRLKGLQSWILTNILNNIKVSDSCKGFEKNTSTLDNAKPHIGSSALLTIDLKDFFPSITSIHIYNIFKSIGYNQLISTVFSNICTYNSTLPQGSPCSPKLANLTAWMLDKRIQGFVGKRGIMYTRYADDLSFSGISPDSIVKIIPTIKSIIESEGFKINKSKTRIAGNSRRKTITGLVINNDTAGIGKKKYRILRSKIHRLATDNNERNIKLLNEVNGWLSYLNSVDGNRLIQARNYINQLIIKYPSSLLSNLGNYSKSLN